MSVLFIRHAQAEAKSVQGDWARGLTARGRIDFRRHARRVATLTALRGIATSAYVRAAQTAEILAEECGISQVQVRAELAPQKRAAARILRLAQQLGDGWALIGHNPSLEEAAARALRLGQLPFKLKKGGAVALRRRGKGLTFQWLASPGGELVTRLPL